MYKIVMKENPSPTPHPPPVYRTPVTPPMVDELCDRHGDLHIMDPFHISFSLTEYHIQTTDFWKINKKV